MKPDIAKKHLVFILMFAVLLGSAFAGGGSDVEESGPITVTLGYNAFLSDSFTDAPAPIDVIRSELAARYPDIELEYLTMPQDMLDSLTIWMASEDDTVDIYGMDQPWVSQFGRAGWAVPLNENIPNLEELITPAGLDIFSYNGKRLGVPFWGSVTGLYYRDDILAEYGFGPPETVDDMVEAVRRVQEVDAEAAGFLWPGSRYEDLVMFYSTLLFAFGGRYGNASSGYQFDSPESLRALQFMRQTIEEGISPAKVQNWERLEARRDFTAGEGVFLWDNNDMVTWLDDPERSEIAGKWGFMPFPSQPEGERSAITGGFAFAANPFGANTDAAVQVLEVIADTAVQKGFALAWGPVQYAAGLYEDAEVQRYNPNVDRLTAVLAAAKTRPPSERYAELSGLMQEELNAAVTGTVPIEDALKRMTERADALEN